ncbi:MAG: Gfo/Idh/MocA family oxidoreductase [Clostridia bacterium]|nr:Gfo/Idh/MocA family oxidoreductase [Clostridia bacterium]
MKQLSLILIGGGDRGSSYLKYLDKNPEKYKLVALAEPVKEKREYLKNRYNVPADMCFESFEKIFSIPKFADIAIIATQDKMHYIPAMQAIEKKYDLLLEKPIAPTPEECYRIAQSAKENGVKVLVCHVLRYTPFYKAVKKFIADGRLGEVMNVIHTEGVGNVHMSHSYVRGNWSKLEESAPMLLAKSCHDTDLMQWLINEPCKKVQSIGTLSYFCKKNKPEGAPKYCTDGCPHSNTCFYYAPDLYKIDTAEVAHFQAIVAKKFNPTEQEVEEALKTSPYGRCVFQCDNNVVDHQVVNMQFGHDKYVSFTMSGFNKGGRTSVFMGTKGELRANMENQTMDFYDYATRTTKSVYTPDVVLDQTIAGGHGGGDFGIMEDLYEYIANNNPSDSISDVSVSCLSHLICFAAEKSREQETTIDMDKYVAMLS